MNWRKPHRLVALISFIPLLFITLTGVVLQLRNQFVSIQPPAYSGPKTPGPYQTFEQVIATFGEENIDQIILKPKKNNLAVRLKNGDEAQINAQTGEILFQGPRRTSLLIELHQGSWLGPIGQYGLHLLTGLALCFLLFTGLALYPFRRKL